MIAAIHQPQYLPWTGYFDKIRKADAFCFLDNVQYKKNEWQNRNRIKTAQGLQWLTVPVRYKFPQKIKEVEINNSVNWKRKHLQSLITNYSKSPFFKKYIGLFEKIFSRKWQFLSDLNISITRQLCEILGLGDRQTVIASDLNPADEPTGRLIDICKALGADTYLSGKDGGKYMDLNRFKQEGINVIFQDFIHPVYPQLFGDFQSHMSIIDLLFNCGPDSLKKIADCNP